MHKLVRITTVPVSLDKLLDGQLTFMKQYYEVLAVSSDQNNLKKVAEKQGVSFYTVNLTRKITPLKDLVSLWKLYRFLKKEKPFIVHTHTPKAGTIGMLAAKLAGVPHRLHTVAGLPLLETTGATRRLLNMIEKLTYAWATRVYPNSFGLKAIIINEKFCSPGKLKVIASGSSNGINTSYFSTQLISQTQKEELKKSLGLGENDFVFIFVGRLVGDKGINELVSAFTRLQTVLNAQCSISKAAITNRQSAIGNRQSTIDNQKSAIGNQQPTTDNPQPTIDNQQSIPNPKLLLIGPFEPELDPLKPETLKEIEDNPDIITTGFREDVRPYFAISDVLVFPSYREGFPNVVMQAGAMGLPSIVTDINGCNEIIHDGENGMIIPPKDVPALLNAMKLLMKDHNLYRKLKQNARAMIENRYEQKKVWNALLEEYRSLEKETGYSA